MRDNFGRSINYLRVSVTDRCNFRCVYCLPRQGVEWLDHSEILTYEELVRLISVFSREGITKVRLTGGEPLVRKNVVGFVAAVASLNVIDDLSLTTNGSLLPQMASELKTAGLNRVNISLDTVNAVNFTKITTCGRVEDTLKGIDSTLAAGLVPVKLNVVLTEFFGQSDLDFFLAQVYRLPIAVRFIECMPFGGAVNKGPGIVAVKSLLSAAGVAELLPIASTEGNGPAQYFQLPQAKGLLGFITPLSSHFCGTCNRMRLTADGKLKPCLLSNKEIDVKTPLRSGAGDDELAALFRQAVKAKPKGHFFPQEGDNKGLWRSMCQIGG